MNSKKLDSWEDIARVIVPQAVNFVFGFLPSQL